MRRALNVALVIAAVLVNVLTARSTTTVAKLEAAQQPGQNGAIVYGLHVALPSHMKNFPPELVPLP